MADIIRADVNKLFQSRRKALADSTEGFKFWEPGNPFARAMNPEMLQKQGELTREQRATLQDLLGKEPGNDAISENNPSTDVLTFLSPQQQQQVAETRERFKSTLQQSMAGSFTDEERKQRVRKAERQMERDLSRFMTPQEKEEHDLRLSQTAAKMRENLFTFEPTEQDFPSIFSYRKKFEDTITNQSSPPADESLRQAVEEKLYAQTRRTLGEARHAHFLRVLGKQPAAGNERFFGVFRNSAPTY